MTDTIYQAVEEVLKENPKAREDDFLLVIAVYVKLGYAKRIPLGVQIMYENIEFAPAFETITRTRREIQNTEQRLQASDEVILRRVFQENKFHTKYSGKARADTMQNSWMSP